MKWLLMKRQKSIRADPSAKGVIYISVMRILQLQTFLNFQLNSFWQADGVVNKQYQNSRKSYNLMQIV